MTSLKGTQPASRIDDIAEGLGVATRYQDMEGVSQDVPLATRQRMLAALGVDNPQSLPAEEKMSPPRLEVPEGVRCYLPDFLEEEPVWGIAAQVYELHSSRNWGIGDLQDVRTLCDIAANAGADFVGLSPLHALFLSDPKRCSPYSPSNRSFFHPIYLAMDKLPGFDPKLADAAQLTELRSQPFVDYEAVTSLKLSVLRKLWSGWKANPEDDGSRWSRKAFDAFKQEGGSELLGHCLFEALSLHMVRQGHGSGWHSWPEEFRTRRSPAAQAFADTHADDVDFLIWLQWLMSLQLADVSAYAFKIGLRLGLYFDFAVGEAPDGSSTWSTPELVLPDLRVGAPPDVFSATGQNWGLVPLSPKALREQNMRPYRDLMKRSMRYAGAMRLDHAMGIWQLFLIPEGVSATEGGYLRYRFDDMIRTISDVSRETRTVMIGEDLGNVPEGFRPAMEQAGILGYRVLYFEADPEGFDPSELSRNALACLSTHDLPPLIGWWANSDIDFAEDHGQMDADKAADLREERRKLKLSLLKAAESTTADETAATDQISDDIVVELHRLLARSVSRLVAVRLADLSGEHRSTNIPGTDTDYPNWRARLPLALEDLASFPLMVKVATALQVERPKTAKPAASSERRD